MPTSPSVATIDRPAPPDPSPSAASALVSEASDLRTFPHVVLEVFRLTGLSQPSVREIEDQIRRDPVLVSRVLRRVNSAFYGLRHRVDSVASAIMYLGTRTLRNVVVMDCLNGYFLDEGAAARKGVLSRPRLFMHGAAVGTCAQLLSRRLFASPGEDAFLAGMVHDIGLLIEAQVREESLRKAFERYAASDAPLVECEREFLGTDHCEVGRALALKWLFPQEIADVVARHHDPIDEPAAVASLCGVIQAADYVASVCGGGEAESRIEEPEGAVAEHIQAHADDFRVLVEDARREIARAGSLDWT